MNQNETFQCFFIGFLDKKGVDTRLQGAQNALLLQEDTIRRSERERKTMLDQIAGLERQIAALENEKKQTLVRLFVLFYFEKVRQEKDVFFFFLRKKWACRNRVKLV